MPTHLTSSIELIFRGTNLVGPAVTGAIRDVDRFQRGVQTAVAPIALLTTGILALEAAGARFAVSFAKDAFDASIDFGRAQTELTKVLGDNEGSVEDYSAQVFELSNRFAVSSTETLGAIASWKQAGFTALEAGELTEAGLKLVIAGDIEAERATNLLIRSIQGFGLAVDEAVPFLDVLNAISNNYGVTLDQLGEGMSRIAPIAANLGFSYAEIAGLLTPVIEQTQSAEISSRGLRGALLNLANPSGEMADRLAELGVATEASDGSLRSVKDILADLAPAFSNLTDEQKAQTAAILGGKENVAALSIALQELDRSAEVTATGLAGIGTSIQDEVNARFKSAAILTDRAAVALDNLKVTIGRQFQTELAGVADGFGEIFRELGRLGEAGGLDKFFAEINPRLKDIERIAREIAAALPAALADADFSGFGDGIDALFGDLSNIKIDDAALTEFVTNVGEGFEDLARFTKGVFDVFEAVASIVGPVVASFGDLDETVQKTLITIGGGALVVSVFGGAVTGLLAVLGSTVKGFTAVGAAVLALNAKYRIATALNASFSASLAILGTGAVAGAVAGVGALAFAITNLTGLDEVLNDAFGEAVFDPIFGFIDKYIVDINGVDEANRGAAGGFDTLADSVERVGAADSAPLGGFSAELDALLAKAEPLVGGLSEIDQVIEGIVSRGDVPFDVSLEVPTLEPLTNFTFELDKAGKVIPESLQRIGAAGKKLGSDTQEGSDAAQKALIEYELKALEVASNERIQIIKSSIEFDIAKLDSDTRQIEAAFESLDTTVESTGDLIGSLFGELSGLDRFEQLDVLNQIEREDRRREEALRLQTKLVEAQIDKIEAQTRQLRKGKALIQVDGSGLAPELESILRKLLELIQIKSSGDLNEYLLNVEPLLPSQQI